MIFKVEVKPQPKATYKDGRELHLYEDKDGFKEIDYKFNFGDSINLGDETYFIEDIVFEYDCGKWFYKCLCEERT